MITYRLTTALFAFAFGVMVRQRALSSRMGRLRWFIVCYSRWRKAYADSVADPELRRIPFISACSFSRIFRSWPSARRSNLCVPPTVSAPRPATDGQPCRRSTVESMLRADCNLWPSIWLAEAPGVDRIVVRSGGDADQFVSKAAGSWLRREARRGSIIATADRSRRRTRSAGNTIDGKTSGRQGVCCRRCQDAQIIGRHSRTRLRANYGAIASLISACSCSSVQET
jgi:hypothetical protein